VFARADARWRAAQARSRSPERSALRGVAVLLFCTFAAGAGAQISGTASIVSDYRYRGITLSDRKPAAQFGLAYDDPSGAYAGAFGSTVRLAPPAGPNFQAVVFGGYALRMPSGVSVEAGADYSAFTGAAGDDYGELYLGIAKENISARIYYSPKYFGQHANAVYGEINAAQPLADNVRLVAHVGVLNSDYANATYYGSRANERIVDGRIGLGVDVEQFRFELAWVGISNANVAYGITGTRSPNTVVLTLSRAF